MWLELTCWACIAWVVLALVFLLVMALALPGSVYSKVAGQEST